MAPSSTQVLMSEIWESIFDSSLEPQFHLSASPTVEEEKFKICPITLLLIMLAATVLVQATIFTHLVVNCHSVCVLLGEGMERSGVVGLSLTP